MNVLNLSLLASSLLLVAAMLAVLLGGFLAPAPRPESSGGAANRPL